MVHTRRQPGLLATIGALVLLVALGLTWGVTGTEAQVPAAPGQTSYAPGEILVKYKGAAQSAAPEFYNRRWGTRTLNFLESQGVHRIKLPADMALHEALALFRQDSQVEYAEPNYLRHVRATPDDTSYSSLWGLSNINAPGAWDVGTDCSPVVVALIDTGADDTHPDLAANIWTHPGEIAGNGLDDDGNGKIDDTRGWDFVFDNNDPMDGNGHGTHVAGTIGAVGNNGRGVTGVCWTAKIMLLRVFDAAGTATVADILEAMDYARQNGARIVNASYSGSQFSQAENDAIAQLNSAGVLLIAAAGNEGVDNDQTPSYPAGYDLPNIMAVAATDTGDLLASFSNFGKSKVHVAAPGVSIFSTFMNEVTALSLQDFEGGTAGWTLDAPAGRAGTGYNNSTGSLADSPGGSYDININVSAVSPAFSLAGRSGGVLEFVLKGDILADGDALWVETAADIAGPWTAKGVWILTGLGWGFFSNGISGNIPDWGLAQVFLDDPDLLPNLYVRFRLQTNASGVADGYYIDDVSVSAFSPGQDAYALESGTSMAVAHVSGLAALVWGSNPGLTASQVKGRILDCVDRLSQLSGSIFTAGRINADNSLHNIPAPPSAFAAAGVSGSRIDLSWDDNYSEAISVKIERRESGSSTFAEIASIGPGLPTYQDTSVQALKTYSYRARASNSDNLSTYTSEVSAIAAAPPSGGGGGGGGGPCFIMTLSRD
jgi:subtilisin family serine protease